MSVKHFYSSNVPFYHPTQREQISWPGSLQMTIFPSDLKVIDLRKKHLEEQCSGFLHRKYCGYIFLSPNKNNCDVVPSISIIQDKERGRDRIFGSLNFPPLTLFYPEEIPSQFQMNTLDCLYTGKNKLGNPFDYPAFANWIQSFFKEEDVPQQPRNWVGQRDQQMIKLFWRSWIQATQEAEALVSKTMPRRVSFVMQERNKIIQEAYKWCLLHEIGHAMHLHGLSHPYLDKINRIFSKLAFISMAFNGIFFFQRKKISGTFLKIGIAIAVITTVFSALGRLYALNIERNREREADEFAAAELRNTKGASHFAKVSQAHMKALKEGMDQTLPFFWKWCMRLITYPNGDHRDLTTLAHGTASERLNHMNRYIKRIRFGQPGQ